MAVTSSEKQKLLFFYRTGDADSLTLALRYKSSHDLANDQIIAIPCSATEILADYSTFQTEVETPISNAIAAYTSYPVWYIILGLNVPGGFYSGDNVISSTSRIALIDQPFTGDKVNNPVYNRSIFKRYDSFDNAKVRIVSRLDSPSLDTARLFINRSEIIRNQLYATGTFYIDPYSNKVNAGASIYEQDLLDFQSKTLPSLGLDTFSTVFLDPYVDSVIPSVINDSFIWSWFTDRSSSSFFKSSTSFRFFAYNADYDGAFTVRSLTDRRWPMLYIRNGYAATAGAMSDPGNDALLRPTPFFKSLANGSTLGEAYLFSVPYLDWTMTLIGDPLLQVSFPSGTAVENDTTLSEQESWRLMSIDLATAVAYSLRQTDLYNEIRNEIMLLSDIGAELNMLYAANNLCEINSDEARRSKFSKVTDSFLDHIEKRSNGSDITNPNPSLSEILSDNSIQMSELIYDIQQDDLRFTEANMLVEGSWQVEFELLDEADGYAVYNFELEVSDLADFSNLLLSKNSSIDTSGWYLEKEKELFSSVESGVVSSYVGRKIRYVSSSNEYFSRANVLFFRYRQVDGTNSYNYRTVETIIYS